MYKIWKNNNYCFGIISCNNWICLCSAKQKSDKKEVIDVDKKILVAYFSKTGATILKGIGIYGHIAQKDRAQTDKIVSDWLKIIGY